jgi:hypothetical protein
MRLLNTLLLILLALALAMSGSVLAAPVTDEQARIVANNYLRHVVHSFGRWQGTMPSIRAITPVDYQDPPVFLHVQLEPAGFLLISTRDELSPVKLYSEQGVFEPLAQ